MIWCPHIADAYLVESLRHRFLRFADFLLDISHVPHDYSTIAEHLELNSLVDR